MAEKLNRTVAEVNHDGMVDAANVKTCGVTLKAGQGILKRGTILGVNTANKCVALGSEEGEARFILCDDTDTTGADVVAVAYSEVTFVKEYATVAADYTLTAEDIDALRVHNITLVDQL